MDISGIFNHNEFYSHHYLEAIFESDIKEVFQKWSKEEQASGTRSPHVLLRSLAKDYFIIRRRMERARVTEDRLALQRPFMARLLELLGYQLNPQLRTLDNGTQLPVAAEITKPNGAPELWILEAVEPSGDTEDPLLLSPEPCMFPDTNDTQSPLLSLSYDDLITTHIFAQKEPPRRILLCSGPVVLLLDRGKWNAKRLLRFDLTEIFSRRQDSIYKAMAALLHRDSVCPQDGLALLDTLDEKSHKHAFSVSEDLKYSLRESIELIGNEAIYYLREKLRAGVFDGKLDEADLTRECLRYMYRLLFVFYIEARPELGYAPMNSDAYRCGYSLEWLRDLEMVELTSEKDKHGYFLHHSIATLCKLIYEGTGHVTAERVLEEKDASYFNNFTMYPLKTHLFDPDRMPILNGVKFRNEVLLKVLNLMSLSREKGKGKRRTKADARGRISYARLGINQLGAVYEALLSYTGFFAQTDIYEVKKAGDGCDELGNAYFVKAEDLGKYTEEERVYNADGTLKMYPRGAFIYRLAGRDRQKSASYYTPEVLTQCLVKYALKELLR
ncbi:MAG: class I SAM-dependent DNA methyltransferase, partial [bacterium]|nr:class I SAM-dependent DNA methyltransferase [bacterium]